jgi:hypothetical protein
VGRLDSWELFGCTFVLFAPNLAEQISKRLSDAALLILVILVTPSGAAGLGQLSGSPARFSAPQSGP